MFFFFIFLKACRILHAKLLVKIEFSPFSHFLKLMFPENYLPEDSEKWDFGKMRNRAKFWKKRIGE